MVSQSCPRLIFGAAGFGEEFKEIDSVKEVLRTLMSSGISTVDTAALYPPTDIGASERLLGEAHAQQDGFTIDTKVLFNAMSGDNSLTPEAITKSIQGSYEQLQLHGDQKIAVLYVHVPDSVTPVKDQVAGFDAEFRKGRFEKLGVCNFPPNLLQEYLDVAKKEGYVKPTVYQGCYNILARQLEGIFPILRQHGIIFKAHSPLATGFISGSLTSGQIEGTRFAEGNIMGMLARQQYDKKEMHDAIRALDNLLEPAGITKPEAALRWLSYHSNLGAEDEIIIGASKISQIVENIESVEKGPLNDAVVSAINDMWKTVAT